MKKIIISSLIIFAILFLLQINTYAASLTVNTTKSEINLGDSVSVTVSFGQKVTSATVKLSYDSSKFDFESVNAGTSNNTSGKVIVSFYDQTGGSNPISSITFKFKSKSTGIGSFSASCSGVSEIVNNEVNNVTISDSKPKAITIKEKAEATSSPTKSQATPTKKVTKTVTPTTNPTEKKNEQKSSNNKLSSLSIEGYTLTPEFNKDTNKYYLSVNQNVNELKVTVSTEDSKAKYEISGNDKLEFGKNKILINVIAEDKTKNEYIIEVNKEDTSIGLSSLIISDETNEIKLTPNFNKSTSNYILNVKNVSELDINATANHEDATIEISGNSDLKEGNNVITITVKKDSDSRIYTLNVYKTIEETLSPTSNAAIIMIIVIVCSLIQSSVAIYFAMIAYKSASSKH